MKINEWFEKMAQPTQPAVKPAAQPPQPAQQPPMPQTQQMPITPQDQMMQEQQAMQNEDNMAQEIVEPQEKKAIIVCPSTCKFANDPSYANKCTLSKIELEQQNKGIFICKNFEDMGSYKQ